MVRRKDYQLYCVQCGSILQTRFLTPTQNVLGMVCVHPKCPNYGIVQVGTGNKKVCGASLSAIAEVAELTGEELFGEGDK